MSDAKKFLNTQVRVDFVVREVCDDGSVPEDELRFVRFGEAVHPTKVKDFFERVGHAIGIMFPTTGPQAITLLDYGPNKINVIKVVRELGGYGLKEAKDLVEAIPGTPIVLANDVTEATHAVRLLESAGARTAITGYNPNARSTSGSWLPSPAQVIMRGFSP